MTKQIEDFGMFNAYVRKALYNEKIDFHRKESNRRKHEVQISELPENTFYSVDRYPSHENRLQIAGVQVPIKQDHLYEVLRKMEQRHRDVVYLSYALGWSDRRIAKLLGMSQSAVQRLKVKVLRDLRQKMKEHMKEKKPP